MLFKSLVLYITRMYPVPPSPIRVGRSAGPGGVSLSGFAAHSTAPSVGAGAVAASGGRGGGRAGRGLAVTFGPSPQAGGGPRGPPAPAAAAPAASAPVAARIFDARPSVAASILTGVQVDARRKMVEAQVRHMERLL